MLEFSDDPELFLHQLELYSDTSVLERCLQYSTKQSNQEWRLPQAYLLYRLKRYDLLQKFLLSLPDSFHTFSQYWLLLGLSYSVKTQTSFAEQSYKRGLQIDPFHSDLNFNLANCLREVDPSYSLILYEYSISSQPFHSHSWHNYGRLLKDQGFFVSALRAFKVSLQLNPFNVSLLCDLGLLYVDLGLFDLAESSFLHSIALDPFFVNHHINLGTLLVSNRRPEDALFYFNQALELEPDSSHALFNLGLCYLLLGNYSLGWKLYDERLRIDVVPPSCSPSNGTIINSMEQMLSLRDHTIIIWSEQGLGDTVQFSRYLLMLLALNISFEFHCHVQLFSFFIEWFPASISIKPLALDVEKKSSNYHCPLLSLPSIFHTDEFSIPSSFPLFIQPQSIPQHLTIRQPPGGLSIGLVWSSNPSNTKMYLKKSIQLSLLMPLLLDLLNLDLIDLYPLQVGSDKSQMTPWLYHPRVFDWSNKLSSFSETAHIVSQLDLVISVDTAVAHLSASLQRPTWLLLPFDADFRWLRDRDDSPWYPGTMRLFRQTSRNDWSSVVSRLQCALNQLFFVDLQTLAATKIK